MIAIKPIISSHIDGTIMKPPVNAPSFIGAILVIIIIGSCAMPQTPDTQLYGKARHSGTATLFRIDDSWHPEPNKRRLYKVGEGIEKQRPPFLPIRNKADIAGIDGPDRIVTNEDIVTVTLKTVFIKYFKEMGGKNRKGEIALVMSFEAGETSRDSILIYSSEGQTLGSYLDLDDMPIIGPIKFSGDDIMVRLVMIEMDQIENETQKQFIRALANTATTFAPEIGSVLSIATPIAEFIINQNADDVILDHRFSLQRVSKGNHAYRNALLFGKYFILIQEDRLVGTDVTEVAPQAILPPAPDRIRFGAYTDRIYRVYNFLPGLTHNKVENDMCPSPTDNPPTFCGILYESDGPIYYDSYFSIKNIEDCLDPNRYDLEYKKCLLKNWINGTTATEIRQQKLGYTKKDLADFDLFQSFYHALEAAAKEGQRGKPVSLSTNATDEKGGTKVSLDFPIIKYPRAFTLLMPYPLHTYLVFSVERSLGGEGRTADERFQNFSSFLEKELGSVRENDQMGQLAASLRQALLTQKKQRLSFKKIATLPKEKTNTKICLLWKELSNPNGKNKEEENILADRTVYNEMFHVTGEIWTDHTEVIDYLKIENCNVNEDEITCECSN